MSVPTIFRQPAPTFFGWKVVWAAFTMAVFSYGVGFYGPSVFLETIHETRGWPISLISGAVTCHFLLGVIIVANLATLHRRFGLVAVTRAGALAKALGILGWALAREPWQLYAATLPSGFGWAATGGAAIDAMVAPWFARRRPAALSSAYNGASGRGAWRRRAHVVRRGSARPDRRRRRDPAGTGERNETDRGAGAALIQVKAAPKPGSSPGRAPPARRTAACGTPGGRRRTPAWRPPSAGR